MSVIKKILNLGSGKGQNIPELLGKGEIYAVDISKESIDILTSRYPQVHGIVSRAEDLDFTDGYFDEIYCFDVLEHVDDLDLVMTHIARLLKSDGILSIEVPYDKSEYMLLMANPDYHRQIGHVRVFEYATIEKTFHDYGWKVEKKDTSRGVANLYLWCLFRLGISLDDQMGTVKGWRHWIERLLLATTIWFDKNIWNTFLKWIPIWIVTLPIGWVMSRIFPKTVSLTLCKR